ncbi:hypothetical protein LV82_01002 [Albidovulum inexpectatum]|uniref:DUF1284 domain-containing protein n=1 Tax=Albidovulum inexpectatum TaxID=196587 RepID=A0A2S5JKK3_9RHOB|nr:DUF1284 domain-containing protein [Albidovulum inexpectatum]PPB81785.1 hypothetical protein LV82_01002 [Albidovulum inexpectatum]
MGADGVAARKDDRPIRFRPHHFLCALGFQGKGYSDRFTANMAAIVDGRLRAPGGDDLEIQVIGAADDICAPCPKRIGRACTTESRIRVLDRAHAAALRLAPREILTWGEAKARILAHVPPGSLKNLCRGCQWEPLGLCEAALADLHRSCSSLNADATGPEAESKTPPEGGVR